jgi:purine-binding chemotaxis protein CheW
MSGTDARLIIFWVWEDRYALDLQEVAEVYKPLPEFPIPNAPGFLRGIVTIHGSLVPVLDMAMYLGRGVTRPGRDLLVLRHPGTSLALAVEHVERIAAYDAVIGEEPAIEQLVSKTLLMADGPARMLDVQGLVEALEQVLK